ncbi:MAG: DUF2538 family protein [Staphylococcus epidermidis]|nr:DUF2538 family protein [Staphylococcus epidermidis]
MSRKTYEKIASINGMFNVLEQQIIHSKDMALFRNEFFYVNHEHRENYEALLIYYKDSLDNPVVDGACYILALPEIFNKVDVFESDLPFTIGILPNYVFFGNTALSLEKRLYNTIN